jgi:hypothetical protein
MDELLFLFTDAFIEYELLKDSINEYEVYYYPDLNLFKDDTRKKIAVFPYVENIENLETLPLIKDMSSIDLLVLYHWDEVIKSPEKIHKDITQSFNTEKYVVVVGGHNTTYQYNKDRFLTNNFAHGHVITHNFQSKEQNNIKLYDFECLFGTIKPARKYIYYKLLESNLLDKSILNIKWNRDDYLADINFKLLWPNISTDFEKIYGNIENYESTIINSIEPYSVNNLGTSLHDYFVDVVNNRELDTTCYFNRAYNVPTETFNVTKYSLVSETYQQDIFHPTEKTAKMFLGKRIFVMFSCQYFLKHLKNMGFKTFDNIIDESYDSILDTRLRFDYAFEQVKYLNEIDYDWALEKTKEIREHNYAVLTDLDSSFNKIKIFIDKNI